MKRATKTFLKECENDGWHARMNGVPREEVHSWPVDEAAAWHRGYDRAHAELLAIDPVYYNSVYEG